MRIGLVSFEFPPSAIIGGIGTYSWQASRMLARGGSEVEVFCGAPLAASEKSVLDGIKVCRINAGDRQAFAKSVPSSFARRHESRPFDVIESPEIGCEALALCRAFPDLPLVVKLHTSSDLLAQISHEPIQLEGKLRFFLGGLRRGRLAWLRSGPSARPSQSPERAFTASADEVAAPSRAIAEMCIDQWQLDPAKVSVYPLPFSPPHALLALPPPTRLSTVGFLGRLETRKGVFELAEAMLPLLRSHPHIRLHLIGPSWPTVRGDSVTWLRRRLRRVIHQVVFVGTVEQQRLASELAQCDVMLLPSRWESFGLVCAESMAAGRVVIGSSAGGMAEVIEDGISGLLVPPRSPRAIRAAISRLIENPALVPKLAEAGRQRVLAHLNPERILPLQLASYERAILRARERCR